MKLKITIALALMVILTGCQKSYDLEVPEMPEKIRLQYQEQLSNHYLRLEQLPEEEKGTVIESEILLDLGVKQGALGMNDAAIETYKKVLIIDPQNFVGLNNLMEIYKQAGDYELARPYVEKLYELYFLNQQVIDDYVRVMSEVGEFRKALNAIDGHEKTELGAESPEFIERLREEVEKIRLN